MPTLKQLTCNVEWSASGPSLPLQEYGTAYSDGLVETYIAIPPVLTVFSIRLKSDGYIAPGLSMFVYIDGEYQCNRGRNNLKIPNSTTQKHQTNIDFVVRQKEEPIQSGDFIGRQWRFGKLEDSSNMDPGSLGPKTEHMGTIEVVVLRSAELQRTKAPNPSASEQHPLAFAVSSKGADLPELAEDVLNDFGGLFDGPSDDNEHRFPKTPFGGDMARDDDYRGPHFGQDWSTPSQSGSQRPITGEQRDKSHSTAPNSASNHPASPAIVINVNQPASASTSPWISAEPQPWNTAGGSAVDSWASTPVAASVHGGQVGADQGRKGDNGWQTWIQGTTKPQIGSPQPDWKAPASGNPQNSPQQSSSSSSNGANDRKGNRDSQDDNNNNNARGTSNDERRRSQARSISGGRNLGNPNQQLQDNSRGWKDQRGNSSGWEAPQSPAQRSDPGWNNNTNEMSYDQNGNTGWNNTGNDDGNQNTDWDNTGSGNGNNNQDDNGWGNNDNNGDWSSGQNYQGYRDSRDNQGGGGWNTGQKNGQEASDWNGNGHGDDGDHNPDNTGYDANNYHGSGNDWDNANTGAQEPQAITDQGWNMSGDDQGSWGQTGVVHDNPSAGAGGFDPAKPRRRRASSGKAKSAISNLSKQASINSAAQKMGWGPSNANNSHKAGSVHSVHKPPGPPGAWPDDQKPLQNGSSGLTKPYHVTLDAAGNPRLPDMQPAPPVVPAPLPPPPPPPPPVQPTNLPYRVQSGEPALYQHKVGSPRYIDSHDRPYAVFVFRYRTKAVLEQILNITIPESDDIEKAKLASLSKEELIAEVIKTKQSRVGSNADSASVKSFHSVAANVSNNANWNTGPGHSGNGFGAALNDKLAAIAAQNNNSSSTSNSGNNGSQGWNNAPPGSAMANNGNGNFGGPSNGHAPYPPNGGAPNNSKWDEKSPDAPSGSGGNGLVETWLDKTPAGASVSEHKPWRGSVKNGGGSNKGGSVNNQYWNGNNDNWAGSQKSKGGSGGDGSWPVNDNENKGYGANGERGSGHQGGAASQKNGSWKTNGGHGSQAGGWDGHGNNRGSQTGRWNDQGGRGWDASGNGHGNEHKGHDEPIW
ncbi:MAG: hypothetical protein Q9225_000914 [Loekoesia sp. 1 TL-2023]